MDDPAYLLEQARRCRRLGQQLGPPNDQALIDLAEEFEAQAREITGESRSASGPEMENPAR